MGGARASPGKRYAPDCGTKGSKFLSRAAAVATRRYYRPGKTVDGERRPFSVCDDFGCHALRAIRQQRVLHVRARPSWEAAAARLRLRLKNHTSGRMR